MPGGISRTTQHRMAPTVLDAHRLASWVDALSPEDRRAFWAGVALMDGAISVDGLVEGWAFVRLPQR